MSRYNSGESTSSIEKFEGQQFGYLLLEPEYRVIKFLCCSVTDLLGLQHRQERQTDIQRHTNTEKEREREGREKGEEQVLSLPKYTKIVKFRAWEGDL